MQCVIQSGRWQRSEAARQYRWFVCSPYSLQSRFYPTGGTYSPSASRTAAAASSTSSSFSSGKGLSSGPVLRTTLPPSDPPTLTWKAPFSALAGSPGTSFSSSGFQARFPLPRGWPKTRRSGKASLSFSSSDSALTWNLPQDLQARMTTALDGTAS